MKSAMVFITFIFLSVFALQVSVQAQIKQNEVQLDELLRLEIPKGLKFLASTKEDVKILFGEDCANGQCVYDENWFMHFVYVSEVLKAEYLKQGYPRNKYWITKSKPEFIGKLLAVEFTPRKLNVLSDRFILPQNFKCRNVNINDTDCFTDGFFFRFAYKMRDDSTIFQREIKIISQRPPKTEYDRIVAEIEEKELK